MLKSPNLKTCGCRSIFSPHWKPSAGKLLTEQVLSTETWHSVKTKFRGNKRFRHDQSYM